MKTTPRCVVIAYDEDNNAIETCTVSRETIESLRSASLVVPLSIDDEGGKADDEFARKLGAASLLLLAVHQPALASYITVTRNTEPTPDPTPPSPRSE
ncbi:hypothetical protein NK8_54810 (plasmid) [Caballeronia sp. NK8]|uniref:hypothetical protein n=1 Tax=Caballeronia sp. NK8 TaxID=140098 RepID=UPI001BB64CB7|nr:hypothetical protein [Caballeronia sp. NK8]BCQ27292.1 hypothetical protein NK8_54810 [Caballeronia sp. NK8]